jgi:type II secretory pathway component GspD/PulD (secretin)
LERLVPQVYEPYTEEQLSDMIYNPANNMLIVKNTPTNLDNFEKQLAQIDVTPKQVSIEAKFLTVSLNDLKKIGFKWDTALSDKNKRTQPIPSLQSTTYNYDINGDGVDEAVPFYSKPNGSQVINNTITKNAITALTDPTSSATPTFSILHNILNNGDGDKIDVTFDYLDSLDSSELLSAPRVTTMNRKPAVVADFTTDYYVTSVNTQILTTGYGLSGTASTNFVQNLTPTSFNFGIALSVTPQIRDNDQVRLWLNPEVRTKTGEKSFDQKQIINGDTVDNTINLPTTSWQAVWTNVIVHDGDTLVLGGMVRDQSTKSEQKLPYIADIPIIGFFFKGKSRESQQSSLLIFVTPDIIDSTGARFFDIGRENTTTTQNTGSVGASEKTGASPAKSKAKAPLKATGRGVNRPTPETVVKSVAPPTPAS